MPDWWPKHLPDSQSPSHGWTLSWILVGMVILIILGYLVLENTRTGSNLSSLKRRLFKSLLSGSLVISALLALLVYHDFGLFRYGTYYNEWDIFHYYVGTKYAKEVGYKDMYAAALIADSETGQKYRPSSGTYRDLESYELVPIDGTLAHPERYKNRFTKERWREFRKDISWFKDQFPPHRWSLILSDHGYNGTPAWTFLVGGLLTSHLSIGDPIERFILIALDPLLWIAGFLFVGFTYGHRTALLMVVFIGTHYLMSWGHMKGALLRTDFAVFALIAVCLIQRKRYTPAGILLGWSVLSRVFPLLFLIGPLIRLFSTFINKRKMNLDLTKLFLSFSATIILVGLGSLIYGGASLWEQWIEKITHHYAAPTHWAIGFQPLVDVKFVEGVPHWIDPVVQYAEETDVLYAHYLFVWTIRAVLLVPAMYFSKWLRDDESISYGFVFLFFLVAPTYYYLIILVIPFLFFARDPAKPVNAIGLIYMFITGIAGHLLFSGWDPLRDKMVIFQGWKQNFQTYYYMSWLLMGTVIYMIALAAVRAYPHSSSLHTVTDQE